MVDTDSNLMVIDGDSLKEAEAVGVMKAVNQQTFSSLSSDQRTRDPPNTQSFTVVPERQMVDLNMNIDSGDRANRAGVCLNADTPRVSTLILFPIVGRVY